MSANSQAWLFDALDTVFFREGRAFQAGEASDVRSVFPPLPSTAQGIVRSKLLADHCGRWRTYGAGCKDGTTPCTELGTCQVRQVVGERRGDGKQEGGQGTLVVRGPWPVVKSQLGTRWLLPTPGDLVANSEVLSAVNQQLVMDLPTRILVPADEAETPANFPPDLARLIAPDDLGDFEPVRGWMAWPAWELYLRGVAPGLLRGINWFTAGDLWASERRPGVSIQPGRNRAKDHHLYFAEHVRMARSMEQSIALGVQLCGMDGLTNSFDACTVGGEMRAARIESISAPPWSTPMPADLSGAIQRQSGRFKVVLTQPAWFSGGWRPSVAAGSIVEHAVLTSALMDRPTAVGGWDLAGRCEKPVRPYVPAGSVFYFTGTLETASRVWNQCISESPVGEQPTLDGQGFGHAIVGVWTSDVAETEDEDNNHD